MSRVDIEKINWNTKENRQARTYIATTATGKEFTFTSEYKANSAMNRNDAFCTLIQFAEGEEIVKTRRA